MPSTAFDTAATTQAAPSGAVGGAAFVPGVDRDMGPNRAPRLTKRAPFLYFAHPERWQILDGDILPLLGKLKLQPGVMGVQRGRAPGAVNLRLARVACEERGRTIIPVDSVPPTHVAPGEAPSYLRTIDSTSGPVVLSRYAQAFAGSAVTKCNKVEWAEFLRKVARTYGEQPEHKPRKARAPASGGRRARRNDCGAHGSRRARRRNVGDAERGGLAMPYNKLDDVRRSLNDKLRKDTRYDKTTRDRMVESAVRKSAERIEKQVKRGERSGT